MQTLVTGATGLIGAAVGRELLKEGAEVRVTIRKDSDTRNIDGLDVERAYRDIRDWGAMRLTLQGLRHTLSCSWLFRPVVADILAGDEDIRNPEKGRG